MKVSEARANLYRMMDETAASHEPVTISGKRSSAVLVSAEDWAAIQETLFLLSVPAVHQGSQTLWHLRPVLSWFCETQERPIDRSLIEVSEVTMKVNIARETRRLQGVKLPGDLESLFS